MQTSYDKLKSSPKAHTSTMGKITHRPTIDGPTQKLGVGAGPVMTAGNRLLRRRPLMFLDQRGGEYEARLRDFITSPAHRRCERLHNR